MVNVDDYELPAESLPPSQIKPPAAADTLNEFAAKAMADGCRHKQWSSPIAPEELCHSYRELDKRNLPDETNGPLFCQQRHCNPQELSASYLACRISAAIQAPRIEIPSHYSPREAATQIVSTLPISQVDIESITDNKQLLQFVHIYPSLALVSAVFRLNTVQVVLKLCKFQNQMWKR